MGYLGTAHTGNTRIIKLDWFKAFFTVTTAVGDELKQYGLKGQQLLIIQNICLHEVR